MGEKVLTLKGKEAVAVKVLALQPGGKEILCGVVKAIKALKKIIPPEAVDKVLDVIEAWACESE